MARTTQMAVEQVRPSTRSQTLGIGRKALRPSNRPKSAASSKSKSTSKLASRYQPPPTTRVLRSTTSRLSSFYETSVPPPSPNRRPSTTPKKRRARSDPWLPKRKPKVQKPRSPPRTHFTCRVCAEELPAASFIKYMAPWRRKWSEVPYNCVSHLACNPYRKNHEPVCRTCIGASMVAKHDLVGARRVSSGCLEPGCKEHWEFDFIMRFFPKGEELEKYNLDMFAVYLADTTLFTCVECESQGWADPRTPGYPNIQCPKAECAKRFCVVCKIPWHTGLTCSEHAARNINATMTEPEKDTLRLMQERDGKRCPNCYLVIEKDGGCDSMYCEGCKKYFNWATAASAIPGTEKAVPGVNGWATLEEVVCEMDGLERAAESSNGQVTLQQTTVA